MEEPCVLILKNLFPPEARLWYHQVYNFSCGRRKNHGKKRYLYYFLIRVFYIGNPDMVMPLGDGGESIFLSLCPGAKAELMAGMVV